MDTNPFSYVPNSSRKPSQKKKKMLLKSKLNMNVTRLKIAYCTKKIVLKTK